MSKKKYISDYPMVYELAIRRFLGEAAYHTADEASDIKTNKKRWQQVIRRIYTRIQKLDTTTQHREAMFFELERLEQSIKYSDNPNEVVAILFSLIGRILGFLGVDGEISHESFYYQKPFVRFNWEATQDKTSYEIYKEYRKNTVAKQKEIIQQLKKEGYDEFKIALILNTSEYMIKKILKDL